MKLVLVALLAISSAGGSGFVVQADRSIGGLPIGAGTLAQASAHFGAPTRKIDRGETCNASWAALGLRISFLDFAGHACRDGGAVQATITNRARWRTDRGLRVGDPVARIAALYPRAKAHSDGTWLVPRKSCKETGGQPYPGLLARTGGGKVTAFVVVAGVCE